MIEYEFDEKIKKCIICNSDDIKDYLKDFRGINISRCGLCGFQFMNPQYTDNYLTEYYSQYTNDENFDYWNNALLYGHNFYLSLIEKHVKPGKILDIGCGNGHLLEAAMQRGWVAHGYDVDKVSTQKVGNRLGISTEYGNFFSMRADQKYDLITMHQVLEHLKDPNKYLERIHSVLNDDGCLFVAVPNIDSFSSRLKRFMEKIGMRKRNIGKYYDTNHHVLYFNTKTLKRLLESHGFRIVYQRNCHSTKPGQSRLKRFIMRNITDHLFSKSAFLVIAKKCRTTHE
ncbi:MAG: class I SAM-dependent methyltransferase [Gammaproteobacteria bacterium]|nr:class I SAM-dependent methyltransferase [Gammaproteobacteria bacterium]